MKVIINKNRSIVKSISKSGTINENKYEILQFVFPEGLEDYTKYIEFETEEGKYVDAIEDNKYEVTRAITQYNSVKAQVVCKDLPNDIVFKSDIFDLTFNNSINASEELPEKEKDLLDEIELELQEAQENISSIQDDITDMQETLEEQGQAIETNTNNIATLQGQVSTNEQDISNIKAEQTTQNTNIATNTQDITDIKTEQITQNNNIGANADNIQANSSAITLLQSEAGNKVTLDINSNYLMTLRLLNKANEVISTASIDLPIESMVVNASYRNGVLTLTLQNGNTLDVDISAIISGLVNETTFNQAVARLEGLISRLDTRIGNAETDIDNIEEDIADIQTEQTTQNTNIQTNADNVQALQDKVDLLENLIPTDTATGESLTLSNTARYPFKEFNVGGNTEQQSYTGYNIFNKDTIVEGKYIGAGGGIYNDNEAAFYSDFIEVTPNENIIRTLFSEDIRTFAYYDENKTFINRASFDSTTGIYTIPEGAYYIRINGLIINKNNMMVQKGNTLNDYEPFVGGQASPNPSYPQEIENVSGEVEVKVQNKNLNDGSIVRKGYYNANGTFASNNTFRANVMKVSSNTRYALSTTLSQGFYNTLVLLDRNRNLISTISYLNKNGAIVEKGYNNEYFKYAIFTTPANCYYVSAGLLASTDEEYNNQVMLELVEASATTPTSYEPHEEQTATFPLAEGQVLHLGDTLEDDGIHQKYEEIEFDGSADENWTINGNNQGYGIVISNVGGNADSTKLSNILCNKLIPTEQNDIYYGLKNNCVASIGGNVNKLYIRYDASITSVEILRNVLQASPIKIQYELKEEIIVPYTAEQQTAYNNLKNLYSYKGTTYISSSNEPSSVFKVVYRKSLG